MFCPNCGQPCQDGVRFCQHCGAPLQGGGQPAASGPVYAQTPPAAPAAPAAYAPAEGPVMQTLRRMARSPLYLTCAIGYTCMIFFTLAGSFSSSTSNSILNYLSMLANSSYEMNYLLGDLYSVMPVVTGVSIGSALLSQIPSILVAAGIWMVYASAMDNSGAPIKTTGLTMIRVIQIIALVFTSLLFLLLEVFIAVVMTTLGQYDDSATGIFIALMVVVAIIAALDILYYVKLLSTIQSIRQSIWQQEPLCNISTYVAVLSILGGAVSILAILSGGVFGALSAIGGAVAGIGFGIFLFQYRTQMRNLLVQQGYAAQGTPYTTQS